MEISGNIKSRPDLKSYFVKNAIPTENNFADFVDSVLNQREDGIVKSAGQPLSIEAAGNDSTQKRAINFYWDFGKPSPDWVLSLNPRANPTDPGTAKPGLGITDAEGNVRLFVDRATGNTGVATVAPAARLDVLGGQWNVTGTEGDLRVGNDQFRFKVGVALGGGGKGDVRLRAQGGTNRLMLGSGNADVLTVRDGKVGISTLDPDETLDVNGRVKSGGLSIGPWPANPGGYVFVGTNTINQADAGNYALLQQVGGGRTFLNSPVDIRFRIGNSDKMVLGNDGNVLVAGQLRATGGVKVDGNLAEHVEADGSFYRFGGQVYITVDDNLYIRDSVTGKSIHFNTNAGILVQETWQAPPLQNGWLNYSNGYNPAGYFKDSHGIVHLRGLVKNGAANKAIFTLPGGYRPQFRELFVICTNPNAAGRVDVLNNGQVWATSVNNGWASLDGITFRAI